MKKILLMSVIFLTFLSLTPIQSRAACEACHFYNEGTGYFDVPCTQRKYQGCGAAWKPYPDKPAPITCQKNQVLYFDCDASGGPNVACETEPACVAPTPTRRPTSTPIPILSPTPTIYEDRFTTCDLCGYCPKNCPTTSGGVLVPTPGAWVKCVQCLYPSLTPDPVSCNTLLVDQTVNLPPTPYPGHWYTMIGCISTNNIGGFSQPGGTGNVVQTLLNVIFSVAGGIAFLYVLYGSFLILTSQGDYEKLNQGKRVVYGAIAGLIFSLTSVFLVNLIASGVLKIPGFGNP